MGKVGELYVELGLNTKGLLGGLYDAEIAFEKISTAMQTVAKGLGVTLKTDLQKQLKEAEIGLLALNKAGELTPQQLKVLQDRIGSMKAELGGAIKETGLFSGQLGQLGIAMIGAVSITKLAHKAWADFTGYIKGAIAGAKEEERINTALKSTLAITGREVSLNTEHFKNYAMSMHNATMFTHEQVQGAQTLLLQLTKLNSDGIDQATRGSIGLASALGIDLHSATMLVAKAMEGNYGALGRYGIRVDENLSATEKQTQLLSKLEGMYRLATDATNTFTGAQTQLKKALGELQENTGSYFTQNVIGRKIIEQLRGGVEEFNKRIDEGKASFQDYIAQFRISTTIFGDFGRAAIASAGSVRLTDEALKALWITQAKVSPQWESMDQQLINMARSALNLDTNARNLKYSFKGSLDEDAITKLGHRLKVAAMNAAELSADVGMVALNLALLGDPLIKKISVPWKGWIIETENQLKELEHISKETSDRVPYDWTEAAEKIRLLMLKRINDLAAAFSNLFGGLAGLSRASTDRQIDDLDRYYEAQKKQVANSLLTDQEKADKLKVLDEKQEIARKNIARKAAKDEKAYSVFQAIISTAAAVINAMTAKPFGPWNWVQSALVAALGAVQIATIQAQPLPLAEGAVFAKPTEFWTKSGHYIAGEAGPEAIVPFGDFTGRGESRRPINLHVHNYIGGKEIDDKIIRIVESKSRRRELTIAGASVR